MNRPKEKMGYHKNVFRKEEFFSYDVKDELPTITLHQKETDLFLTMEIEKVNRTLQVTQFTLSNNSQLKEGNEYVREGAMIDFVLEGVKTLLSLAERHKVYEILFILPKEEAAQFSWFGGFFLPLSTFMTREGERTCFALFYSPLILPGILAKIEGIKSRLNSELWRSQFEDEVLCNYLHNQLPGQLLEHKKDLPQERLDNILPFSKQI